MVCYVCASSGGERETVHVGVCMDRTKSRRAGRRESDGKESSPTSSTLLCQRVGSGISGSEKGRWQFFGWRQRLLTRWNIIGPLLDYEFLLVELEECNQVRAQYCTNKWSAITVQSCTVINNSTSEWCAEQMQCNLLRNARTRVGESCFSGQDLHDWIGHWMLD